MKKFRRQLPTPQYSNRKDCPHRTAPRQHGQEGGCSNLHEQYSNTNVGFKAKTEGRIRVLVLKDGDLNTMI